MHMRKQQAGELALAAAAAQQQHNSSTTAAAAVVVAHVICLWPRYSTMKVRRFSSEGEPGRM